MTTKYKITNNYFHLIPICLCKLCDIKFNNVTRICLYYDR